MRLILQKIGKNIFSKASFPTEHILGFGSCRNYTRTPILLLPLPLELRICEEKLLSLDTSNFFSPLEKFSSPKSPFAEGLGLSWPSIGIPEVFLKDLGVFSMERNLQAPSRAVPDFSWSQGHFVPSDFGALPLALWEYSPFPQDFCSVG